MNVNKEVLRKELREKHHCYGYLRKTFYRIISDLYKHVFNWILKRILLNNSELVPNDHSVTSLFAH